VRHGHPLQQICLSLEAGGTGASSPSISLIPGVGNYFLSAFLCVFLQFFLLPIVNPLLLQTFFIVTFSYSNKCGFAHLIGLLQYSRIIHTYFHQKTHAKMLIKASFLMPKNWKIPKCLPSVEWINGGIHTREYYSRVKRRVLLIDGYYSVECKISDSKEYTP
jgi:hypothetical protein